MSKKTNQTNRPERGSSRSSGSHAVKRRIRFDRIAVVVIPFLLIVILISALCIRSLQKSGRLQLGQKDESSTAAVTTTVTSETNLAAATPVTTTDTAGTAETSAAPTDQKEITLSSSSVEKGNLIVVNPEHEYSFPVGDPELKTVHEERNSSYSVSDMDVQLESETMEHLNSMMADYEEATGFTGMQVFSGYRSKTSQDERYESGSSSIPGGCSDYHTGRSFNLKIDFGDGTSDYYNANKYPEYSWISEHAAEYGFVVRYPEGSEELTGDDSRTYTFRYVGVPHAVYMTEHDLCLEAYVALLQDYTAESPLTIQTDDGEYAVYYAASEGSSTHITVLSEEYTVSGDNIDGFIMTNKMDAE